MASWNTGGYRNKTFSSEHCANWNQLLHQYEDGISISSSAANIIKHPSQVKTLRMNMNRAHNQQTAGMVLSGWAQLVDHRNEYPGLPGSTSCFSWAFVGDMYTYTYMIHMYTCIHTPKSKTTSWYIPFADKTDQA